VKAGRQKSSKDRKAIDGCQERAVQNIQQRQSGQDCMGRKALKQPWNRNLRQGSQEKIEMKRAKYSEDKNVKLPLVKKEWLARQMEHQLVKRQNKNLMI